MLNAAVLGCSARMPSLVVALCSQVRNLLGLVSAASEVSVKVPEGKARLLAGLQVSVRRTCLSERPCVRPAAGLPSLVPYEPASSLRARAHSRRHGPASPRTRTGRS